MKTKTKKKIVRNDKFESEMRVEIISLYSSFVKMSPDEKVDFFKRFDKGIKSAGKDNPVVTEYLGNIKNAFLIVKDKKPGEAVEITI